MAEPLAGFFDRARARALAARLRAGGVEAGEALERAADGLDDLGLLDRGRALAAAIRPALPADPGEALRALVGTFGPEHAGDEVLGVGMAPFAYLPDTFLIAELGVRAPEAGLDACHAVTRRFTAEACVRPLLDAHPALAWARLGEWVADPNPHVRRLVSEGTRPRLPWAPRLRTQDPARAIPLLDRLVDDPASVVRRSVANHLGDLAKDDLGLALDTAARWLGASAARRDLIRHGLRHAVKRGEPRALSLLGFDGDAVGIEGLEVPGTVRIGERLAYALVAVGRGEGTARAVIDVGVAFRTARGASEKVFKLATAALGPGERRGLSGSVSFAVHSTRRPQPGPHRLWVQVNGARVAEASFEVLPAR